MSENYIPHDNAHLDVRELMLEISRLDAPHPADAEWASFKLVSDIFMAVERRVSAAPAEPFVDTVLVRYMSLEKFLYFLNGWSVFFSRVEGFDDPHDCRIPSDYDDAVQAYLHSRALPGHIWETFVEQQRQSWLISCWTELSSAVDDYLLWSRYAGGSSGVALVARYGVLKDALTHGMLATEDGPFPPATRVTSGYVQYKEPFVALPFNKRRMFANEREVRFVGYSPGSRAKSVSVSSIIDKFGIRLAPDSRKYHQDSVVRLWEKFGGNPQNVDIAGG
ncbi:MAG: hypothetical protein AAAFM81_12495 [Pseudomonadota bacterium]